MVLGGVEKQGDWNGTAYPIWAFLPQIQFAGLLRNIMQPWLRWYAGPLINHILLCLLGPLSLSVILATASFGYAQHSGAPGSPPVQDRNHLKIGSTVHVPCSRSNLFNLCWICPQDRSSLIASLKFDTKNRLLISCSVTVGEPPRCSGTQPGGVFSQ